MTICKDLVLYSHRGDVKSTNEDGFFIGSKTLGDKKIRLIAVIDGVSGHGNGKFASDVIIAHLSEAWHVLSCQHTLKGHLLMQGINLIRSALIRANDVLVHTRDDHLVKSAAACSVVFLTGRKGVLIHIGDTRVYQMGHKNICLTKDHCLPGSHVLTSCIGINHTLNFEVNLIKHTKNTKLALLSDGFYSLIDMTKLETNKNELACDLMNRMIDQTKATHRYDNVTAIVLEW